MYWHVTVYNIFTVFFPVILKFYFIFYFFCFSDWWFLVLCLHLPGHLLILLHYLICYLLSLGHFVLAIELSNFDWFLFITFSSLLQWSTFLCSFLMPSAFLFCLFWSQDLIDWRGLLYFSFSLKGLVVLYGCVYVGMILFSKDTRHQLLAINNWKLILRVQFIKASTNMNCKNKFKY